MCVIVRVLARGRGTVSSGVTVGEVLYIGFGIRRDREVVELAILHVCGT